MDGLERLTDLVASRLFLPLEASGRHVHLTQAQALHLFGQLPTPKKPLSQPGQFLSHQRVNLVGPKGKLTKVAVLGPCRESAQVEISQTDALTLGIAAPVRLSGDTHGSPGILLESETATLPLETGVVVARRHIHMTPEDSRRFGVADGQEVAVACHTARPVILQKVAVRVDENFKTALHMDYDEANGCGFVPGDFGTIL